MVLATMVALIEDNQGDLQDICSPMRQHLVETTDLIDAPMRVCKNIRKYLGYYESIKPQDQYQITGRRTCHDKDICGLEGFAPLRTIIQIHLQRPSQFLDV